MDMMKVADPDAVHAVRTFIKKQLALELKEELLATVSSFYLFNFLHRISAFVMISCCLHLSTA